MRTWRFGALTVLLGLCLVGGTASADDGAAAVLPFQGPQASKVRQRVQTGLRSADVELVPLKKVSAVVKKTKGYAKQAAKLEASILIGGRIRRSGDRWIADVGVRNEKGVRVEKLRVTSSSVTRLGNRIVAKLVETGRMPVAGAVPAAEDAGLKKLGAAPAPEPVPETPTQPRLVVRPFKGTQAGKIRIAAVRGLRGHEVELVPNKEFVRKAQSLNADLQSDDGHVLPARAMGVNGLLEGDVLYEDGVWSAYVRLIDGKSAKVISQHFYDGDTSTALARAVQTGLWSDFRKDIKRFEPEAGVAVTAVPVTGAAATAAERAAEKEARDAEVRYKAPRKEKKRPAKDKPAAVDIEVDFRMVHRTLKWNDDLLGNLREYTLNIGPGVGAKFQYYPGAHFTAGVGAQFGIDFEWEYLFKFDSTRADGERFPTESQQFLVGLRWRYPAGRWEPTVIADYGMHNFRFGVSGPPVPGQDNTAGIPSVKYQFIRVGGGFRVGIGKKESFIIALNAAFRGVFSTGGIGSDVWFPEAKANGMDAMLMFGYALPKGFEIRIGADYRRYWFDLNPVPPDPPYVAGGALDQYWAAFLGIAWRY